MQCGEGAYQDDGNVAVAKIKSIFELAGANNKPDFTNSLTGFINGATEAAVPAFNAATLGRSEEHTSELQSLMRISYAVFCLKKKKHNQKNINTGKTNNI